MRSPKASSRKSGAKGATRAKSGCYTCRIRRKKCDEIKNMEGSCQTCVRLRLECLGYGPKRPEYLKESGHVTELRVKIKNFLASQGMIKGHSGTARHSERDHHITLRLVGESGYSSTSSDDSSECSPGPLSIDGDDTHHVLTTSSTRDEKYYQYEPTIVMTSQDQELCPDTNYNSPRMNHDIMFTAMPYSSSDSLVPPCQDATVFSHISYAEPFNMYSLLYRPNLNDPILQVYFEDVVSLQYLLADHRVSDIMIETANMDDTAGNAMRLLSKIHQKQKLKLQIDIKEREVQAIYRSIGRMIFDKPKTQRDFTADDAIAALHTISSILFIGGTGEWLRWLWVAYTFSDGILRQRPVWPIPFPQKLSFILTTAMWFDVVASVTLMAPPRFLDEYRNMFNPEVTTARISTFDDGSGEIGPSAVPEIHPPLSMTDVMGCENHVVWAMAEVSYLGWWKNEQRRCGKLCMPLLVDMGRRIEQYLLPREGPTYLYLDMRMEARQHVAEIFRAATRLYLHSVLSDDLPHSRDVKACVEETVECLKKVPRGGQMARLVVRSVVFCVYICGCLAENGEQFQFLSNLLQEQAQERVGNCGAVRDAMEGIWLERSGFPASRGVRWRERLKELNLLLV